MKRYSSHYIFISIHEIYKNHYLELDNNDKITGIFPLEEEISDTAFYNGIIIPINKHIDFDPLALKSGLNDLHVKHSFQSIFQLLGHLLEPVILSSPVHLYQFDGLDLSSLKFGTGNSCSNCYIQRIQLF